MSKEKNLTLSSAEKAKINFITKRLKGAVTQFGILDWLTNFEVSEYHLALRVLEKLEHYSENDIISILNERIKLLLKKIKKGDIIYFVPIGDFGKSSYLISYYLKKTTSLNELYKRNEIFFLSDKKGLESVMPTNYFKIVYYDDYLGSGGSIKKFREGISNSTPIKNILKRRVELVLCLFYSDLAFYTLNKSFGKSMKILGEERFRIFDSNKSIFGYRENMRPVREFCFKYGKGLFKTREGKKITENPLGFKNTQSLISFAHTVPNNTLPIIWSSAKKGKSFWKPLIARNSFLRIEQAKELRSSLALELSILRESDLKSDGIFKTNDQTKNFENTFISKINFLNYAVLKMIRRKRPLPLICMNLGITLSDYDEVIFRLQQNNIIKRDLSLTQYGYNIVNEIRSILTQNKKRIFKRNIKKNKNKMCLYLPKTFNGSS